MAIRAEIHEIHNQAAEFTNESLEMHELITRCDQLVNGLDSFWEGNACIAFTEQWDELKPGLNATKELLESISKQLDDVADIMEETDNELANNIGVK